MPDSQPKQLTDPEVKDFMNSVEQIITEIEQLNPDLVQRYIQQASPQTVGGEHEAALKKNLSTSELVRVQRVIGFHVDFARDILRWQKQIAQHREDCK